MNFRLKVGADSKRPTGVQSNILSFMRTRREKTKLSFEILCGFHHIKTLLVTFAGFGVLEGALGVIDGNSQKKLFGFFFRS